MSKIISFFTAIFFALQALLGIGGMTFGEVTLVPEADTYVVGTEAITATLHNGTFRSIPCGPVYRLEKWDNGVWFHMELRNDILLPDGLGLLRPFARKDVTCNLTYYDPPPEIGRYRIEAGGAYAEFTLVSEGEVTLTPKAAVYPLGTKTVQATWYNGTGEKIWFGPSFGLEQWDGSEWAVVEPREIVVFPAIAYFLEPSQSMDTAYGLSHYDLEAGLYRIAAGYTEEGGTGRFVVYAEFELK